MAYAVPDDVADSLLRELSDVEVGQADVLLDRVENRIKSRLTDLDDRADDDTYRATLVEVEADAVARVFRNPSGLLQEQDGDYAYTRFRNPREVPDGRLAISSEEWARLGVSAGSFSIKPSLGITDGTWPAIDNDYHDSLVWVSLP